MSKKFYYFAIFLLGLSLLVSLFQSVIQLQLRLRVNEMQSVAGWLVFEFLLSLIVSLILLKYFHYKKFWVAFWTLLVSTVASFYFFYRLYDFMASAELTNDYIVALFLLLGAGILYSISLIFSEAGKRRWLKAAGIFLFFTEFLSLVSVIWSLSFTDDMLNGRVGEIQLWISLAVSLAPGFFIVNFWGESLAAEKASTSRFSELTLNSFMGAVAVVALLSTLFFVTKVSRESRWLSAHPEYVNEDLKKFLKPFEARIYVNKQGDTLRYRLLKPLDYDSTRQYPLVVCLHGSSGTGTDNAKQVVRSLPASLLFRHENTKKYPAFLFVPQCPPGTSWGGITNFPAVDSLVFEAILALEEELPIDKKRRYMAGNSLGGYGAWHFIFSRPEMFAAAIPISGGGNPELASKIVDVPVWAFHGRKDRNVPVSCSQDIIEALKKAGGDPHYTEYPDDAHNIWEKVTDTPGLLDWLFAQERD